MQSEMLFLSMFGSLLRILHIANSINIKLTMYIMYRKNNIVTDY